MSISVVHIEGLLEERETVRKWIAAAKGISLVGSFPCGDSAALALAKIKPDVILADFELPDMTGAECIRRLRKQLPRSQFLILSASEDPRQIIECLCAGADGYLLKPMSREELLSGLRDVTTGKCPMSRRVARKVVECFHFPVFVPKPRTDPDARAFLGSRASRKVGGT